MPIISTLKHDPEGIISLSDVDDEEIDAMILNEEESRLKKVIWNNLNRDWIKMQKQKKILKKAIEKKGGGAGATLGIRTNKERKIKQPVVQIKAENPSDAIKQSQKFGSINPNMLTNLFSNSASNTPQKPKIQIKQF